MKLETESRTYRIIGLTPILGSAPASKAVRTQYISSKAPTDDIARMEGESNTPDLDEKGLTVFYMDKLERICVRDYQVKGFLKSALASLKGQLGVANPGAKVDKLIFVEPIYIPLVRDGKPILEEDDVLERPLRAQTMKGERVTLASSEMINDPWEFTMEVTLIPNNGTKASAAVTWDVVETALDYGMFNGLGQWRNASYGKFRWERIEE